MKIAPTPHILLLSLFMDPQGLANIQMWNTQ